MSKRIRVELEGVTARGTLHEDVAPVSVTRFLAVLPLEATLRHVRWSGEAGYILIQELADPTIELENAVSFYPPGSLVFRSEHGEFAFAYGQAQARDNAQRSARATHLATFDTDASAFWERVAATCHEGEKTIRISLEKPE